MLQVPQSSVCMLFVALEPSKVISFRPATLLRSYTACQPVGAVLGLLADTSFTQLVMLDATCFSGIFRKISVYFFAHHTPALTQKGERACSFPQPCSALEQVNKSALKYREHS